MPSIYTPSATTGCPSGRVETGISETRFTHQNPWAVDPIGLSGGAVALLAGVNMFENDVGRKSANVGIGSTVGRSAYRRARARLASAVKSTISNRHIYFVDLLLSAAALMLAMWLRLGPQMFMTDISEPRALSIILFAFVVTCAIIFPLAGLYKRKWEYASISDYIVVVEATIFTSLVLMTLIFFFSHFAIVAHSIVAIEIMVLISFLTGARLTFRHDLRTIGGLPHAAEVDIKPHVPVLLVGAGNQALGFPFVQGGKRRCEYEVSWPLALTCEFLYDGVEFVC